MLGVYLVQSRKYRVNYSFLFLWGESLVTITIDEGTEILTLDEVSEGKAGNQANDDIFQILMISIHISETQINVKISIEFGFKMETVLVKA